MDHTTALSSSKQCGAVLSTGSQKGLSTGTIVGSSARGFKEYWGVLKKNDCMFGDCI